MDERGYRDVIQEVVQVLEGKSQSLIAALKKEMAEAAENEDFEMAASYRDQIRNLELITETQGVFEAGSQRNRDVLGIALRESEAHGTVLKIRSGRLTSVQHYHLQNTDSSSPIPEVLAGFLSQYYLALRQAEEQAELDPENSPERELAAQEVLLPEAPQDCELLENTLGIRIRVSDSPVDEQLLNVARANAEYALEQNQKKQGGHGIQALEEVQEKLHLLRIPHRIECYDISNIQGQDAVASRVVFIDGAPDKNLYRRYKIRTVQGANDFAMMREVLDRRFSKGEEELPDLVVVDGGKGQLGQAVAILEELAVQGVGVVGLAKARVERNFKATEVKSSSERVFIPNRKNPVPLLPQTGAYKLLTHVRDEAHRFAISYHRLLRSKRSLQSRLSDE
jgi:excinuclease ABC subunit C